ncbi:MAG: CoA transferase, partial [Pseudomonadota bacterium]
MSSNSERIGVVVIHGVGETAAGWTGDFLLPRLEHWLAHDRVASRTPYQDGMLRLRVRTIDQDVAILVADNPAFAALCETLGAGHLASTAVFSTTTNRLKNRDLLIGAIEDVVAGANADELVARLNQAGIAATATFDRAARVHGVRDPGSSNPTRTWVSFSHAWRLNGRQIMFSELFWADMSKVGYSIPTRLMALIQLFLESPYILGRAFLRGGQGTAFAVIRWLILTANWLMRWPIAGLNVAIFAPAILTIFYLQVSDVFAFNGSAWLPAFVAGCLLGLGAGGYAAYQRMMHRQVGLADLSLSGAFYSVVLLALLVVALALAPIKDLQSPENYLLIGIVLLLISWFLWSLVTVLAVIMIGAIALKRLLLVPPHTAPRLARLSAALSLSLLLGIVWKFVLALLGLMVITLLVPGAVESESCQATDTLSQLVAENLPRRCLLANVS